MLVDLAARISPRVLEDPARLDEERRELDDYFAGHRQGFELPIDWQLSHGFHLRARHGIAAIPYGETRTYTDLARGAGNERAVRAAGSACSRNPIPLVVPCHRVLRSDGSLGGYAGGLEMKERLLEIESAPGRSSVWTSQTPVRRRRSEPMKRILPCSLILSLLGALVVGATTAAAASSRGRARPSPRSPSVIPPKPKKNEKKAKKSKPKKANSNSKNANPGATKSGSKTKKAKKRRRTRRRMRRSGAEEGSKGTPCTAPVACQVSRAESTITTLPSSDQVRLTVRYRTWAPTPVTVSLKLRDHKGAVGIEHTTKHLGGGGVLHITTKLGSAVMERAPTRASSMSRCAPRKAPATAATLLEQRLLSVKHTGAKAPRVYSD